MKLQKVLILKVERSEPAIKDTKGVFKESQVEKMSAQQYEKKCRSNNGMYT